MSEPRRRIRLANVGGVLGELKVVYRKADRGEIDWQDARAATLVLREIRAALETSDLERRLADLEQAVNMQDRPRRAA